VSRSFGYRRRPARGGFPALPAQKPDSDLKKTKLSDKWRASL
jgi:hypothetical protein